MILGSTEDVVSILASVDTHETLIRVTAIELSRELPSWIILFVTADISKLALAIVQERWSLLSHGITIEMHGLLRKVRVVDVHCPWRSAIIRVNIDLRLGHSTGENSSSTLSRCKGGTLSKINLVVGLDNAVDTEGRL